MLGEFPPADCVNSHYSYVKHRPNYCKSITALQLVKADKAGILDIHLPEIMLHTVACYCDLKQTFSQCGCLFNSDSCIVLSGGLPNCTVLSIYICYIVRLQYGNGSYCVNQCLTNCTIKFTYNIQSLCLTQVAQSRMLGLQQVAIPPHCP